MGERRRQAGRFIPRTARVPCFVLLLFATALPLAGRDKEKLPYGEGLIVNIPLPVGEVQQVVEDVAQNGIIRGTKEYNKDEYISGAKAATSSHVFPAWTKAGKVFYKVREQAIDPRNFKDSSDAGSLVVRYVVQAQGEKNTVLRIDALFKEDYRHLVHQSNGSVESSEYKDIQEHLEAIEVMKKQNVEAEKERQEQLAKKHKSAAQTYAPTEAADQSAPQVLAQAAPTQDPALQAAGERVSPDQVSSSQSVPSTAPPDQTSSVQSSSSQLPSSQPSSSQSSSSQVLSDQSLENHVKDLRKQVERLVKAPGAPLKSAPFHTASTLQTLTTGTEVLILISTPYWYGVETHEGQHGWIIRDELEQP